MLASRPVTTPTRTLTKAKEGPNEKVRVETKAKAEEILEVKERGMTPDRPRRTRTTEFAGSTGKVHANMEIDVNSNMKPLPPPQSDKIANPNLKRQRAKANVKRKEKRPTRQSSRYVHSRSSLARPVSRFRW